MAHSTLLEIPCHISFGIFQLYEEEKSEKERLKRDLEYCKKELREAKLELDRQMKRSDANRVSETNDKRVRNSLPVSTSFFDLILLP